MLISVNGTTIDTKDIWQITDVKYYWNSCKYFEFIIKIFNGEQLSVILNYNDKDLYDIEKGKILNLRNSIVKIWQENQSEIPQFNL